MAQTERPGDGEAEHLPSGSESAPGSEAASAAAGAEEETAPRVTPEAAAEATGETAVLPPSATPSRGTAAPLGTVGDGRYRLTHRLGRGGMAEVFAAHDVRLGRTVAVKLLRPELGQDDIARQRFTREAHSVAALNHHSIVAVYDTGEEQHDGESTPYIVMELVEGRTVRELLVDEEAPPVDQALIIVAGVLEALSYSHRHGIVHRDIKPANVIITTSGAVKVMDFGIARALTGAATTMTQTGMVMGTPQYLSPEQALGKAVDHRSDLYAAGCMLYELLTLRPPFVGETPLSVVYQHVQDAPVPPSQVNQRVPAQFDDLVLRALAKNPDDRYQSADEFRAHLQHALRQMHGAGGAGYAAGAAAAAAAVAGLAAAGSGNGGAGPEGSPSGGTSITEPLGAFGAEERTTALPYQVTSPYQTPSQPYQGAGGGGGGDETGGGPEHRRNPWGWALALVALILAAAIGVAIALSTNHGGGGTPVVTQSPETATAPSAPESPSQQSSYVPPSRAQTTPRPTESPSASPSPSRSHSGSPSPSASSSASPSESPSSSESPTPTETSSTSTATGLPVPPITVKPTPQH